LTWIFWNVAVFHCTFVNLGFEIIDYKQPLGLFNEPRLEDPDDPSSSIYTCMAYRPEFKDEFDGALNAARFFGAFGYIVHTLAFFIAIVVMLCLRHDCVPLIWMIVRVLVIVSLVCSLLIFSAFGTEMCADSGTKCSPGGAGIAAIFNIFFIIAVLVFSWLVHAPDRPLLFVRLWQEGDGNAVQTTTAQKDEDSTRADPTQTMNDETSPEVATPAGAPTMSYIQAETEDAEA
jgi:hypothetical protein